MKGPLSLSTHNKASSRPPVAAADGFPHILIVGAPKCGTTSLHSYLHAHPGVCMSGSSEPGYFLLDRPGYDLAEYKQRHYRDYKCGQLAGEATTGLLFDERAPERIWGANPCARIIICVRPHAEALHSRHTHQSRWGRLDLSFEQIIDDEIALLRSGGARGRDHGYFSRYRYAEQIERFRLRFGAEAVWVQPLGELKHDTVGAMQRLTKWLGLPEFDWRGVSFAPQNKAVVYRHRVLRRLSTSLREGARRVPFARDLPRAWRQRVHSLLDLLHNRKVNRGRFRKRLV